MLRAAVYLRISLDHTGDGAAVDRQREDAATIAAARGWDIVGEYVDNSISASKVNVTRPSYARLERDYATGKFDAIICYDLDRLTRQPRQLEDWIDAAEQRGLIIVTMNGEADLGTDAGRLFARIKAAVARSEVERKGERQRRANQQRTDRGLPLAGHRLYGYEKNGTTPITEEATIVRRIFDQILAGASVYGIARDLNDDDIPMTTSHGKCDPYRWAPRTVRGVVQNRRYAGDINRYGEWLPSAAVTPIVDPDDAARARAILADPARRISPGPARKFLLSSIATCGVCGATLKHVGTGTKRVNGAYGCRVDKHHVFAYDAAIDAAVLHELAQIIADDATAALALADENTQTSTLQIAEQLDHNSQAAMATSRDRDEGLLPDGAARTRLLDLRAERVALEQELDARRIERSAAGTLLSFAAEAFGTGVEPLRESLRVASEVEAQLVALPLDHKREVLSAFAYVKLLPSRVPGHKAARGARRVQVVSRLLIERGDALGADLGDEITVKQG